MPDASRFASGFTTCTASTDLSSLPVRGTLPAWLRGTLYRNGPATWEVGRTALTHWFDGFAKLHRFGFAGDGVVSFRCRMLESQQYRVSLTRGKLWRRLFATEQKRRWWHKLAFALHPTYGDNALVNIISLAGGIAALTESPRVVRVNPQTLAAEGDLRFDDQLEGNNSTAHPVVDPRSGDLINLLTKYGKTTRHQFTRQAPGSRRREVIGILDATEPSYHHFFGLTKRFIVFTKWPFVMQPLHMIFGNSTIYGSYRWKPELGLRIRLLERATGRVLGPFTTGACFGFHHVNAWDRNGGIDFDVAVLHDHQVFDELLMKRVRTVGITSKPLLTRFHIELSSGEVRRQPLGEDTFDFPLIDERVRCQPTTVVWGCGVVTDRREGMLNRIGRREFSPDGSLLTETSWQQNDCFPGEPVFVPRPGGTTNEGVLLSVVLDGAREQSFLLVLDATTLTELARAEVPQVVPFGFHGSFVPG
ncbi:MAG TPA: carotenoid oxygenase family protein [Planctomycetota bacterium]|nr:carotenoid oxygenase family protein [Planctomycetota bacterium]